MLAELLEVREREGAPARVRRLAELRRRGEDDRHRSGDPGRSSTASPTPPTRRAGARSTSCWSTPAVEGEDVIDFSNWRHHLEALKRERFDVDAQEVRRYFDFRKVRQGLLDVTSRLFGLPYEQVDGPGLAPRGDVVRRPARGGRPAPRPHPPRPEPARPEVQPRRAVHPRQRGARPPAPRGGAGLQLLARADGSRPRGHAVPRVRPPDAPRARRAARVGPLLRRRHRVGLRGGAVADARGVGLGRRGAADLRHRRRRRGDPRGAGGPDARGRRVRQGLPDPHPDGLRGDLLLVPPGAPGRPDRPAATS